METILIMAGLTGLAVLEGSSVGAFVMAAAVSGAFWIAALWQAAKGGKPRAKEFALKAAAYMVLIALLFGLNAANKRIGRLGMERIAAACEAYKAQKGTYPEALAQLAPEYIKNIPPAKASLRWSRYWLKGNQIMFASEPGLVVAYYDLAAKEGGYVGMYKMLENR
ncbi:MAG TPA: hypothetical protein DCS63_04380 [Elusimicrobia bacterium]|nr:hypothetical protein [Elusimicrobiota bacterium]